jgi:hypothetical protein
MSFRATEALMRSVGGKARMSSAEDSEGTFCTAVQVEIGSQEVTVSIASMAVARGTGCEAQRVQTWLKVGKALTYCWVFGSATPSREGVETTWRRANGGTTISLVAPGTTGW